MRKFKELYKKVGAALAVLLVSSGLVFAQVPALPGPPYNVDMGSSTSTKFVNTAQGAATVNFATQTNLAWSGVVCVFNQTAIAGTPSITFGIQMLDTASGQWITLVSGPTSPITTALNTPAMVGVLNAGQFSSTTPLVVPPASGLFLGMHLPKFWRVTETVAGTGTPTTTGTIGCNLFR